MQPNSTLPALTPFISPIKKAVAVAGLSFGAFLLSKIGWLGRNNKTTTFPKLPQRRVEPLTTNLPSLREAAAIDASLLGNKGLNLSNLLALGFNVPDGLVVITRVYEEHIQRSGVDDLIEELSSSAYHDSKGTYLILITFNMKFLSIFLCCAEIYTGY